MLPFDGSGSGYIWPMPAHAAHGHGIVGVSFLFCVVGKNCDKREDDDYEILCWREGVFGEYHYGIPVRIIAKLNVPGVHNSTTSRSYGR